MMRTGVGNTLIENYGNETFHRIMENRDTDGTVPRGLRSGYETYRPSPEVGMTHSEMQVGELGGVWGGQWWMGR